MISGNKIARKDCHDSRTTYGNQRDSFKKESWAQVITRPYGQSGSSTFVQSENFFAEAQGSCFSFQFALLSAAKPTSLVGFVVLYLVISDLSIPFFNIFLLTHFFDSIISYKDKWAEPALPICLSIFRSKLNAASCRDTTVIRMLSFFHFRYIVGQSQQSLRRISSGQHHLKLLRFALQK